MANRIVVRWVVEQSSEWSNYPVLSVYFYIPRRSTTYCSRISFVAIVARSIVFQRRDIYSMSKYFLIFTCTMGWSICFYPHATRMFLQFSVVDVLARANVNIRVQLPQHHMEHIFIQLLWHFTFHPSPSDACLYFHTADRALSISSAGKQGCIERPWSCIGFENIIIFVLTVLLWRSYVTCR